jgi:uncharacterized membrane protein
VTQSNPSPDDKAHSDSSERAPFSYLYFDLALILIITAAAIVLVFAPSSSAITARAVAGLLLIFFVPGYAFLAAVFPLKESITNVERVIFSLVFSVIIVGGVGLLLSYTQLGLSSAPVVASTSVFVVVSTCAAYVRRRSLSSEQPFAICVPRVSDVRRALSLREVTGTLDKTLVVVLILILVTSLVATVYLVATPFSGQAYTELYVLGPDGKAQDYPSQFRLGEEQSVIVGVTNHEQRAVEYTLVTSLNGTTGSSTLSSEKLSLANNQNWEQTVAIRPDQTGKNLKLSFLLYANNDTSPLQTTHLWVNVTA